MLRPSIFALANKLIGKPLTTTGPSRVVSLVLKFIRSSLDFVSLRWNLSSDARLLGCQQRWNRKKNDEDARSRVEDCVASICRRMDLNALELNHGKTEIMLIHSMYHPYESFTIWKERDCPLHLQLEALGFSLMCTWFSSITYPIFARIPFSFWGTCQKLESIWLGFGCVGCPCVCNYCWEWAVNANKSSHEDS